MARGRKRQTGARRRQELGSGWDTSGHAVLVGLKDWRALHPRATLADIEVELDRRLNALRAQLLTDLALASTAAEVGPAADRGCPACGGQLTSAGARTRTVRTLGNEGVRLTRDYGTCSACGSGSFPPG